MTQPGRDIEPIALLADGGARFATGAEFAADGGSTAAWERQN